MSHQWRELPDVPDETQRKGPSEQENVGIELCSARRNDLENGVAVGSFGESRQRSIGWNSESASENETLFLVRGAPVLARSRSGEEAFRSLVMRCTRTRAIGTRLSGAGDPVQLANRPNPRPISATPSELLECRASARTFRVRAAPIRAGFRFVAGGGTYCI